ncbi:MAG: trehalose-6-phosphate synthase [Microthrixaceae bacterium]|nr:trehalose-6-phosphate synthase [Microthrixaceae bacterium]
MAERPVVIVSNRGPVSFRRAEDGSLEAKRGAGGLVSGLGPLVAGTEATWIAAALSDADREAAAGGVIEAEGFRVRALALDPDDFALAYDVVANAVLWFVHHGLFETARRPRFDRRWREAWAAYRRVNEAFADAVVRDAPEGAAVLVQDYHLCLVAPRVAEQRPDLVLIHFSHTPFAPPELLRVLPDEQAHELLTGLAAHHACGFHCTRWAADFTASAHAVLGQAPPTFVSPLPSDPEDLAAVAASPAGRAAREALASEVGDRRLLVRVDRIELSKNLLRGFLAYDDLLAQHPEWRERVVFGAFVYPSREGLPEYLAYRQEVERVVADVNRRWATDSWTPVLFDPSDDFPRSVAALSLADVLLVNPVRDGLNLVAKEGTLVSTREAVLALSPEAGVWEEVGHTALRVHPFDVAGTADALHAALSMPADERRDRHRERLAVVRARSPRDWLDDLLAAAGA